MRRRLTSLVPLLVLLGVLGLTPLSARAQAFIVTDNLDIIPVTGTLPNGRTLVGEVTISGFSVNDERLFVTGVLNAVVMATNGTTTNIVDQLFTVAASLQNPQGACDLLFLDIRPIFLDLLGLQVNLSRITLDINAVPGSGNLLGNLLCAIVRLLD